jgi:hypothetical protein
MQVRSFSSVCRMKRDYDTSSPQRDPFLNISRTCYATRVLGRLVFYIRFAVKWGNTLLRYVVTTIHKTRCEVFSRHTVLGRAQLWANDHGIQTRPILRHALSPQPVLLQGNTRCGILVDGWNSVWVRQETQQTPAAGRQLTVRTPANGITAVENLTRHRGSSQPRVLEVLHGGQLHPHHCSRSALVSWRSSSTRRVNACDINPLRMGCVYTTFCGQTMRVWRVWVFNVHNSRPGHGVILVLSANVCTKSVWVLALNWCRRAFPWALCPAWPADCSMLSCGFRRWSSSALRGRCRQWSNATYPGRWVWRGGPIAWPPQSPDLTPISLFLRGHLKEHVYSVPPRTIEDLVARLQAAVDLLGRWQHVKPCTRQWRLSAFKWTEAASKSNCNYEAPMVRSVDGLRLLTCILRTKHYRTYVPQCFRLPFSKESQWRACVRISFHPVYNKEFWFVCRSTDVKAFLALCDIYVCVCCCNRRHDTIKGCCEEILGFMVRYV